MSLIGVNGKGKKKFVTDQRRLAMGSDDIFAGSVGEGGFGKDPQPKRDQSRLSYVTEEVELSRLE